MLWEWMPLLSETDRDVATLATWTALVAQGASAYGFVSLGKSRGEEVMGRT